jgi:hypothetical protein
MVMSFDSVVLLVMTDGRRDCIERTLASAAENLHGPIRRRVIHDDSGDGEYAAWLRHRFPGFSVISDPHGRQGFGGAINSAWAKVGHGQESYVFHLEDDFVFQRPVSLEPMMTILGTHPYLVQLALRRQPWNDEERTAGGIVEQYPADYADKGCCDDHQWLEHRRFFTTNPSLYRRSLCDLGWPISNESEGRFSARLAEDTDVRFGFWGARDSGEWVEHIGNERVGIGY